MLVECLFRPPPENLLSRPSNKPHQVHSDHWYLLHHWKLKTVNLPPDLPHHDARSKYPGTGSSISTSTTYPSNETSRLSTTPTRSLEHHHPSKPMSRVSTRQSSREPKKRISTLKPRYDAFGGKTGGRAHLCLQCIHQLAYHPSRSEQQDQHHICECANRICRLFAAPIPSSATRHLVFPCRTC